MPTGPISREHPGDQLAKLARAGADLSGERREPSGVAVATTLAFIAFLLTSATGARDTAPIVFVGVFAGVLVLLAVVMLVAARKERAQHEQRQRILLLENAAERLGRAGITKLEQFGLLARLVAGTPRGWGYELDRAQADEIYSAIQAAGTGTGTESDLFEELALRSMRGERVSVEAAGIVRTNRELWRRLLIERYLDTGIGRHWLDKRLDLLQGAGDPGIGAARAGHVSRLELKLLAMLARDRKRADYTAVAEMFEVIATLALQLEEKRRR